MKIGSGTAWFARTVLLPLSLSVLIAIGVGYERISFAPPVCIPRSANINQRVPN
jgi:hypothetical protein